MVPDAAPDAAPDVTPDVSTAATGGDAAAAPPHPAALTGQSATNATTSTESRKYEGEVDIEAFPKSADNGFRSQDVAKDPRKLQGNPCRVRITARCSRVNGQLQRGAICARLGARRPSILMGWCELATKHVARAKVFWQICQSPGRRFHAPAKLFGSLGVQKHGA